MPQMGIQPEKEREGEGERERFDMEETSLSSDWPILYCPEKPVILLIVHRDQCGEGNGTPLQYSCLENPMDGEAW